MAPSIKEPHGLGENLTPPEGYRGSPNNDRERFVISCHSPLMKMVSEPVIRFIDFLSLIRVKRLFILERTLSKPIKRGKCLEKL